MFYEFDCLLKSTAIQIKIKAPQVRSMCIIGRFTVSSLSTMAEAFVKAMLD